MLRCSIVTRGNGFVEFRHLPDQPALIELMITETRTTGLDGGEMIVAFMAGNGRADRSSKGPCRAERNYCRSIAGSKRDSGEQTGRAIDSAKIIDRLRGVSTLARILSR